MNVMIYSFLNLAFGGGFERWVKEVTPRLVSQGYRVYVVTSKAGDVKDPSVVRQLTRAGVHVIEVDNYSKPLAVPKLRYFKKILSIAKDSDVLYFNNAFAGNEVLVRMIKSVAGTKVIAGYRGLFPHLGGYLRRAYHSTINKNISKTFDAHHVVNRDTKKLLLSFGYRHVYHIPNGVDITKFRPGKKNNIFTVLFVGRLDYQKGFDIFAQIVEYLNRRYENEIRFVICGKGPLSHIVERLTRNYKNVEWLGYVSGDALVRAYQKAHVLVASSRFEEFLFTSIEAQACGTPVIAFDIPGPRDNIINVLDS